MYISYRICTLVQIDDTTDLAKKDPLIHEGLVNATPKILEENRKKHGLHHNRRATNS